MNLPTLQMHKKNLNGNFQKRKQPSMKKLNLDLAKNLNLINMQIYQDFIVFKADPSININEKLVINSNTKEIYYQETIIEDIIDQFQFSYLIGVIELRKNLYVLLVKNCIPYKLANKNIYQVQEIFAWNVQKRQHNKILSDLLTDYYSHDFWFSYQIDLTFSNNVTECLNDKYNYQDCPKKNLMFYSNFGLHCPIIKQQKTQWLIPLICGYFYGQKIFDVRKGCQANCWLIYKKSINSIFDSFDYQQIKKHPKVYEFDTVFDTLDVYTGNIGQIFKQQFILSKNPKQIYRDQQLQENHYNRFVKFMRQSQKASIFFFNNRKIWDFLSCQNISSHDYFFIDNHEKFSQKVPKLILKSILDRNDQIICLVYDKIIEDIQQFFNNYFEHIPETPRIQNFKRKRNSLFNNLIFNNIQLCQESEVVHKTIQAIHDINCQFYQKIQSIQNVRQYFKTEEKIDLNFKINKNKKFINSKIRQIVDLNKKNILSQKKASIIFITHNCSGVPKKSIKNFINYSEQAQKNQIDFVIIGLQEIVEMKGRNLSNILLNDNEIQSQYWKNLLQEEFKDYILIGEVSMLGLMTLILQNKNSLEQYNCKIIKSKLVKQGFMSMANKGGVIILLQINWYLISILNLHLPSGTKKQDFKKRIENLSYFEKYLEKKKYINLKIILGDFNFRNQIPAEQMIEYLQQYQVSQNDQQKILFDKMLKGDEYINYQNQNYQIELPYEEETIQFLPSYKFQPNTTKYYTKEGKRSPSWTDRIFFNGSNIPYFSDTIYDSDKQTIFSDHRQFKKTCLSKRSDKC